MWAYDINGDKLLGNYPILVGAVLDANSADERFTAMKQLFDIAVKKLKNPQYQPETSDFTAASKGAVCVLPAYSSLYEGFPFDILYSKNPNTQAIPASTTKVMTTITGMAWVTSIKDKVTLVSDDIQSGSGNYFSAGDILSIEDLIYGMMLPSSNTCARAYAHYVGAKILNNASASVGDCVTAFLSEMNKKASLIGCTNSMFTTPSGLSTNNFSCVADMLRITIEGCSHPELCRIWNKKSYDIAIGGSNPRTQHITSTVENSDLESEYYILGGKTGYVVSNPNAYALVMVANVI